MIETLTLSRKLFVQSLDRIKVTSFKIKKTDNDIRDLNTRVVDVILDLDVLARACQNAGECVSENVISYMADVCGFVRIDRSVLDTHLCTLRGGEALYRIELGILCKKIRTVEEDIQIARSRDVNAFNAGRAFDRGLQGFADRTRIRLFARLLLDELCKLKCNRERQIAKLRSRRNFGGDILKFYGKMCLSGGFDLFVEQSP